MLSLGILFAIGAMLSWGFGDFLIQRASRQIGIWQTLFFIGIGGFIGLFPFVKDEIPGLFSGGTNFTLLGVTVIVATAAALFYFAALKVGKIAIIEPITAIELPIAIGLAIVLAGEHLAPAQTFLALLIFIGIMLAVTQHHSHLHYHKRILEKGVILALVGAVGMGLNDFLMAKSTQNISPILAIWFIHSVIGLISFIYLMYTGEVKNLIHQLKKYPTLIFSQAVLDNIAWVCYALAVNLIPISITVMVSETYIALGVLLGVFLNREKLKYHQYVGIAFAIGGVIFLAAIS